MSTFSTKPRDLVADLLLQLTRDEQVTKPQLNEANNYYSSIVTEIKSLKDLVDFLDQGSKGQGTPHAKTDNGTLHSALEKLRTENSALKTELETIKKGKKEPVETNAGHQDDAADLSATKQENEHYKNTWKLERQAKNDLEQSLTKLKEDNERLRHELAKQETNFQKAKEEQEHYQEKEKLESKANIAKKHQEKEKVLNDLRGECEDYKQQLESLNTIHSATKQEIEHYKNKEELDKQAKNGLEQSLTKLKEHESLRNELEAQKTNFQKAMEELEHYQRKEKLENKANIDTKHQDKAKILGQEQGYSRAMEKLRQQNHQLNEEKDRLLEQIRELRNRLSVIAAHKLTDGNPAIADLSDSYRPTKLAEMFRQLYDDEWTHAFEELDKHFTNKQEEVIDILVKIIKDADQFCERVSKQQYDSLKHYAKLVMLEPCYQTDGKEKQHLTCGSSVVLSKAQEDLINKLLKDFRKSLGSLSKNRLTKIIHDECLSKFKWNGRRVPVLKGLEDFLDTTVEFVWMMKIQDPPMELAWSTKGCTFDKNMYTPYTIRGNTVAQCVWPAVVLHRGGPLMSKGVVQGK